MPGARRATLRPAISRIEVGSVAVGWDQQPLLAPPQVHQMRTAATQQGAGEGCVVPAAVVQEVGGCGVRATLRDRPQSCGAAVGRHRHHVPAESADHQVESGVVAPRQPQDDLAVQEAARSEQGVGGDEGAPPAGELDQPGLGQRPLRAAGRGRGGRPLPAELTDTGELVARDEVPGEDPARELLADLPVSGHAATL